MKREPTKLTKPSGIAVHGCRSSFRDWAGNETHFARELAEAALAHVIGDKAEQSYRRSDALEKRRALMEAWATVPARRSARGLGRPDRRRRGDVSEVKHKGQFAILRKLTFHPLICGQKNNIPATPKLTSGFRQNDGRGKIFRHGPAKLGLVDS
ncbi:hypothetical protein [Methylocella sp.]|uniref:hypothetical protein n=1 Tax=Methylocella sp. TaxID=1978226 RepID=UPI0037831A43